MDIILISEPAEDDGRSTAKENTKCHKYKEDILRVIDICLSKLTNEINFALIHGVFLFFVAVSNILAK